MDSITITKEQFLEAVAITNDKFLKAGAEEKDDADGKMALFMMGLQNITFGMMVCDTLFPKKDA